MRHGHDRTRSVTLGQVLRDVDRRLVGRDASRLVSVPTGFDVLDDTLGGGLRPGELTLVAGIPGVGKTIMALQMARAVAREGGRAVVACYEHEPATLLGRLLALEAGEQGGDLRLTELLGHAVTDGDVAGRAGLLELLAETDVGRAALARLRSYEQDLVLVRASGAETTVDQLRQAVVDQRRDDRPLVLFVDYLQKVALHPEPELEAEKITRTVEGIKDLALELEVPVVLLSAVDAEGMRAARTRLHHLRGSTAIAFEADVVLLLNDKYRIVSKVHRTYDPVRAQSFRPWVVVTVEKNRGGPNLVDLELRRDFAHYRFHPEGGLVAEQLIDERVDESEL